VIPLSSEKRTTKDPDHYGLSGERRGKIPTDDTRNRFLQPDTLLIGDPLVGAWRSEAEMRERRARWVWKLRRRAAIEAVSRRHLKDDELSLMTVARRAGGDTDV
jgi:hypothetical protein